MRVKRYISCCLIVIVTLCLSSCALLFNEKSQCIKIRTDSTIKLLKVDTTKLLYHEPGDIEYYVKRGKQPLRLDFSVNDTILVSYQLRKKLSPAFLLANSITPMAIGYVVDLFHKKKYMYSGNNYFSYDTLRHKVVHYNSKPARPDLVKLKLGWNYANIFHSSLFHWQTSDASILGLNLGAEYFIKQNQSLQVESGYAFTGKYSTDRKFGYKIPKDSIVKSRVTNFWLMANYKIYRQRWAFGAGLSFAGLKYYEKKDYFVTRDSVRTMPTDTFSITELSSKGSTMKSLLKGGLSLKLDYKLSEFITLGCNWHCFVGDFNKVKFYTSHFLNFHIDFTIYEINLKRKKQSNASNRPEK